MSLACPHRFQTAEGRSGDVTEEIRLRTVSITPTMARPQAFELFLPTNGSFIVP